MRIYNGFNVLYLLILSSCNYIDKKLPAQNAKPIDALEIKLFNSGSDGFGYSILIGAKEIIHQPSIPAVQSLQSFATKEEAKRTAELVKQKIIHLISPPSITIQELDSMHVKYK
jgi:Domain of unknown function (DUF4907)